ncbi:ribosomal protein L4, mitochondrial, putative [Plasmodium vivax]|uniref:Large ribosomal subunit protein uL4m n=2 Tax=Plasmodium vivax TaxID=5855 RepID=A5K5N0_PLAVS|nr:hypothetical protein, conserved [Plasmodium vivax]EDL45215.1 hypothetical protein, conserved [Plasmodium vivax]KMZ88085.1 hypothetical protein PVBG_02546 [Plasmodium vivax Brazil I]CAI7718804.1 ribosomal protein L4, mitochondrial, putative [Plasmodium vivax]|eukprot:XP_001614942.1 hypothetical protein [Plasmodium vivax Sal-1]
MTCSGDFAEKGKNADMHLERVERLERQDQHERWEPLYVDRTGSTTCEGDADHVGEAPPGEENTFERVNIKEVPDEYKFIFERPKHIAHVDDEPVVRRPGCIIDIKTLLRNNWTFPAVGFNSKLEIPVYKFECSPDDENIKYVSVPNDIFGLPIRPDILHKCYYFYRTALAGYTERMQLYKWEWPGSTKKYRSQKKSGKARMNWRKTCGRYLGVKNHPLRPFDQRTKINRKLLWRGMKIILSAKFAQDQIKVVDNFLIKSHKTKYAVKYLRNILGNNCNSALLVHEGKTDVNDNFFWACANIASVKRENVQGVNIYNLLKYRFVVFTYKALQNLTYELKTYPHKMKWLPTCATPDSCAAPVPEKVKNWDITWKEKKRRNNFAFFDKEALKKNIEEWKWSSDLKGALKVKKKDPYMNFILTKFSCHEPLPEFVKYEYLFNVEDSLEGAHGDVAADAAADAGGILEEMLKEDDEDDCLEGRSALSALGLGPAGNDRGEVGREGAHDDASDGDSDADSDDSSYGDSDGEYPDEELPPSA